ncbi:unnamed protein product [Diamesa tonsa]
MLAKLLFMCMSSKLLSINSKIVLISPYPLSDEILSEMISHLNSIHFTNFIFAWEEAEEIHVYGVPLFMSTNAIQMDKIEKNLNHFYPDKLKDLREYQMKIAVYDQYPRIQYAKQNYIGLDVPFVRTFVNELNATFKFYRKAKDSSVKDLEHEIAYRSYDMCVNTDFNSMTQDLNLIPLNEFDGFCALIPKERPIPFYEFIFYPFEKEVWYVLAVTLVIGILVWIISKRVNPNASIGSFLFKLYGYFLGQGSAESYYLFSQKLVLQLFIFAFLILGTCYQSLLVALILEPRYSYELKTFDEVKASNLTFAADRKFIENYLMVDDEFMPNKIVPFGTTDNQSNNANTPEVWSLQYGIIFKCSMAETFLTSNENFNEDGSTRYYQVTEKIVTTLEAYSSSTFNPFEEKLKFIISSEVWYMLAVTLGIGILVWLISKKVNPNASVGSFLFKLYGYFLGQGSSESSYLFSQKLVLQLFIFAFLILGTCYQSLLVALILEPKYSYELKTFDEVKASNLTFAADRKFIDNYLMFDHDFMPNKVVPFGTTGIVPNSLNTPEVWSLQYGIIFKCSMAEVFLTSNANFNDDGSTRYYQVAEKIVTTIEAYPSSLFNPFEEKFKFIITAVFESGIKHYWKLQSSYEYYFNILENIIVNSCKMDFIFYIQIILLSVNSVNGEFGKTGSFVRKLLDEINEEDPSSITTLTVLRLDNIFDETYKYVEDDIIQDIVTKVQPDYSVFYPPKREFSDRFELTNRLGSLTILISDLWNKNIQINKILAISMKTKLLSINSKIVLISPYPLSIEILFEMITSLNTIQFTNFIFAWEEAKKLHIYGVPLFIDTNAIQMDPIENKLNDFYPDKLKDLKQYPMKIAVYDQYPRYQYSKKMFFGLDVPFVRTVVNKLNATFKFYRQQDSLANDLKYQIVNRAYDMLRSFTGWLSCD